MTDKHKIEKLRYQIKIMLCDHISGDSYYSNTLGQTLVPCIKCRLQKNDIETFREAELRYAEVCLDETR